MQEEHALPPPPTHTVLGARLGQQCQGILLNDQCSTHRGCSKRKISACSKPGMAQLLHIPGPGGGKRCKLLGSSACLPDRYQELLLLLSKCSHHMHRDNMIPPHPSPFSSPTHWSSESPSQTFKSIMLLTKSSSWLLIMMDTWGWFIICFRSRSQSCQMPGKGVPRATGLLWGRTRMLTQSSARALGTPLCPATPPLSPAPAIPSDMLMSLGPPWSSASA